jgi:hypothetical protein
VAQPVEQWFSKIERDVTARGIFNSVTDRRRKLMRYIQALQQDRDTHSLVLSGPVAENRMIAVQLVSTVDIRLAVGGNRAIAGSGVDGVMLAPAGSDPNGPVGTVEGLVERRVRDRVLMANLTGQIGRD